jgi:CHAT domain-containing protein
LASRTVHLLHFAGHGRFDDTLPEESGFVIDVGQSAQILSAGTLKALLAQSGVEIAVLSCCVGAKTAKEKGKGDFQGIVEAIARAGVPIVLGHRWTVPDTAARAFALTFYEELMTTLSPGVALLRARNAAAADPKRGRDNPMWVCPVLVSLVEP